MTAPILTVYVNTQNRDAFRHARVSHDLAWIRKDATSLFRTLLPEGHEAISASHRPRGAIPERQHPEEKALAIFSPQKALTVIPPQTSVDREIRRRKRTGGVTQSTGIVFAEC